MNRHVKIVGILHIVYGLLLLGLSLTILFSLGIAGTIAFFQGEQEAATILGVIGTGLSGFFALLSIPDLLGAWALLTGRSWGRTLVLVFGFIRLIDIPFGTALGIYTIWALLRHDESSHQHVQITSTVHSG